MKNLAGDKYSDECVLEELYLAGLEPIKGQVNEREEVKTCYTAELGGWTFTRKWSYWSATVDQRENGLPVEDAVRLYNLKSYLPDKKVGDTVRAGGGYGEPLLEAMPCYNQELDEKLFALGYKKKYIKLLDAEYFDINKGEISKLCIENRLDVKRWVDVYHIDDIAGLVDFVKFLKNLIC